MQYFGYLFIDLKFVYLFIGLFFLSRLLFLNPQPVFFDAPEYLTRLANQNLLAALASGHPPFHGGYILIFWPIWQIISKIGLNPVFYIEFFTVILGFLTIFVFYKFAKNLFGRQVAFWATLLISLTPYFWITNVSVMVETPYIFFFILSLYFFVLYLKKAKNIYLVLAGLCFGFSWFIHTIIIVWLPAFVSCYLLFRSSFSVILRERKRPKNLGPAMLDRITLTSFARFFSANWRIRITKIKIIFLLSILLFFFANVFLLYHNQIFSLKEAFIFGLVGKTNEHLSIYPLSLFIPRVLRNWLILTFRQNTPLLTLIFSSSLLIFWKSKKNRLFWALLIWFLPSLLVNQWWDSVLLGRHGITGVFPISIGVSYLLIHKSVILNSFQDPYRFRNKFGMTRFPNFPGFIIIFYLLLVSLGALWLLRQPIPYLEESKAIEKLPANGLLLETHFARPWVKYEGRVIFINEPGWTGDKLIDLINQTIKNEQPVFATTQALSDPYGLYCGPYLNPLSLNPKGEPELKYLFDQYHFEKIAVVDEKKNLFIWQIKPKTTPEYFYHDFRIPFKARERLDFFDPLSQFWFLLVKYF